MKYLLCIFKYDMQHLLLFVQYLFFCDIWRTETSFRSILSETEECLLEFCGNMRTNSMNVFEFVGWEPSGIGILHDFDATQSTDGYERDPKNGDAY